MREIVKEAESLIKQGAVEEAVRLYVDELRVSPENLEVRYRLGLLYLQVGRLDEAIEQFRTVLKYDPNHTAALSGIGRIYLKKGKYENALLTYEKVARMNSGDMDAQESLGDIYAHRGMLKESLGKYNLVAEYFVKNDLLPRAKEAYSKILKLAPHDLKVHQKLAEIYAKVGDEEGVKREYVHIADILLKENLLVEAKQVYQKLLEMDPQNIETFIKLSEIHLKEGQVDEAMGMLTTATASFVEQGLISQAIRGYQRIIEMGAKDPEVHLSLSSLYLSQDRIEEAIRELKATLELNPAHEKALAQLAQLYTEKGLIDDAINSYKRMIELNPSELNTYITLGELYVAHGLYDDAIPLYTKLAQIYEEQGELEKAIEVYKRILECAPENLETRKVMGGMYVKIGEIAKAIDQYIIVANAALLGNRLEEAIEFFQKIVDLDPENINVHQKLCDTYLKCNRQAEAMAGLIRLADLLLKRNLINKVMETYQRILELDPKNIDVRQKLAQVYAEKGLPQEAVEEEMKVGEIFLERGMIDSAIEVFQRLAKGDPNNKEVKAKLKQAYALYVGQISEEVKKEDFHSLLEEIEVKGEKKGEGETPPSDAEFLDDVLREFKQGVEGELGPEDYESRYNLGIAYKEMGLIDEAIGELQIAAKDPKRFLQACSLLGLCFIEKGMYEIAIRQLKKGLEAPGYKDEDYLELRYHLALAYEKAENLREALKTLMEIYAVNAKYRDVAERIKRLQPKVAAIPLKTKDEKEEKEPSSEKPGKEKIPPQIRKDRVTYL